MFFTSGIIIAFFCFAFYLIWNQFLKKDARLSTGLQILRKKLGDLENLSLSVETQVDRSLALTQEKTRKLESLLQRAKGLCDRIEKNIKVINNLNDLDIEALAVKENDKKTTKELKDPSLSETKLTEKSQKELSPFIPNEVPPILKRTSSPSSHLKMVTGPSSKKDQKKKWEFGESPFKNIEFIDSP
ncbi:MAG: hypothetical protein OXM55_02780 [Bdellovibrionales bacterium]|nr:hypothetical protein [Bdellovibrionales bacterium]